MIDDIRNWLGDIASGKIKDAHIALSEAQNTGFLRDIENLICERDDLLSKVRVLETSLADSLAENRILASKLPKAEGSDGGIDQPTREVLQLLFDAGDGLDIDAIRSPFGFSVSEAKFHIGILMDLKFIRFEKGSSGFVWGDSSGMHSTGGRPDKYVIQQKGLEYIMKKNG